MALQPGTHKVGPDNGTLHVHTYREGMAQKAGHDLIIAVEQWEATVEVGDDGAPAAVELEAAPTSLRVREGRHGLKPLSDKDIEDIHGNIETKILGTEPIAFRSREVRHGGGTLTVEGDLTMAGTTRPATFLLDLGEDGRVGGTVTVTQSDWGIKPYKGLMGALKVRDDVEVSFDVALPSR